MTSCECSTAKLPPGPGKHPFLSIVFSLNVQMFKSSMMKRPPGLVKKLNCKLNSSQVWNDTFSVAPRLASRATNPPRPCRSLLSGILHASFNSWLIASFGLWFLYVHNIHVHNHLKYFCSFSRATL